mmetsp:Transcript_38456/g.108670  ORF Transcript_38456/g.108670 Transcript_38456/m.108670 type:complete len:268 (+) Transcript_38456:292-1095(+)
MCSMLSRIGCQRMRPGVPYWLSCYSSMSFSPYCRPPACRGRWRRTPWWQAARRLTPLSPRPWQRFRSLLPRAAAGRPWTPAAERLAGTLPLASWLWVGMTQGGTASGHLRCTTRRLIRGKQAPCCRHQCAPACRSLAALPSMAASTPLAAQLSSPPSLCTTLGRTRGHPAHRSHVHALTWRSLAVPGACLPLGAGQGQGLGRCYRPWSTISQTRAPVGSLGAACRLAGPRSAQRLLEGGCMPSGARLGAPSLTLSRPWTWQLECGGL